jgi:Putative Flp pilus-assembly TadE/G-like
MSNLNNYSSNLSGFNQHGIIIPLFSLLLIVFLAFLGLLVGGGSLLLNKIRLDKVANLSALAAIESYMKLENDIKNPLGKEELVRKKIDEGLRAAKNILIKNSFLLSTKDITELKLHADDGSDYISQLRFGLWLDEEPEKCPLSSGCSCDKIKGITPRKPCFISLNFDQIVHENVNVNAAEIAAKTPEDAWYAPFAGVFNRSGLFSGEAKAVAKVQDRCTVFAVDISSSSFADTHMFVGGYVSVANNPNGSPNLVMANPYWLLGSPGNYAIGTPTDTTPPNLKTINNEYDCVAPAPPVPPGLPPGMQRNITPGLTNYAYWCEMRATRGADCADGAIKLNCPNHFRSDYDKFLTPHGEYYIDIFRSPEPLTSIMLSINSGLRTIQRNLTSVDRFALIPFSDVEYSPIPHTGMTRDLSFMIDMTDMRRTGKKELVGTNWVTKNVKHPNFIDRNWIPMDDRAQSPGPKSGTNILRVLDNSIKRLTNSDFCPASAKKSIVLATDGVSSQYYKVNPTTNRVDWNIPSPIIRWRNLLEAEDLLFRNFELEDNILRRLLLNKISLTTMLVGEIVQPHFINIRREGTVDKFLSINEMAANGFRGFPDLQNSNSEYSLTNNDFELPSYLPPEFQRWGSPCHKDTYNKGECTIMSINANLPGTVFRRPNGVFAQISILSSGIFCPLNEPYRIGNYIDNSCYDKQGNWYNGGVNCKRNEWEMQTKSIFGEEIGGQAARCVRKVLGTNPYSVAVNEEFLEP